MVSEVWAPRSNACPETAWTEHGALFPGGEPAVEITKSEESTSRVMKLEQQGVNTAALDPESRFPITVPNKCL